jgi:hypothetical protein
VLPNAVLFGDSSMFRPLSFIAAGGLLLACGTVGCSKTSKPDYSFWTQPASPEEQVTPAFTDVARDLLAAIENEHEALSDPDTKLRSFESTVWRVRDDAAKKIRTRSDRNVYVLLEDYAQKVSLIHMLSNNPDGASYLPALRGQVQSCHDELKQLFATQPVRSAAPMPATNDPCIEPIPRGSRELRKDKP